jgi:hypothetical protein
MPKNFDNYNRVRRNAKSIATNRITYAKPRIDTRNFFDTKLRNKGVGLFLNYLKKNEDNTLVPQEDLDDEYVELKQVRRELRSERLKSTSTIPEISEKKIVNLRSFNRYKSAVKPQLMLHREDGDEDNPAIIGLTRLDGDFFYNTDAEEALRDTARLEVLESNEAFVEQLSGAFAQVVAVSGEAVPEDAILELGYFRRGMAHPTMDIDYPVERFVSVKNNPVEYRLAPENHIYKIQTYHLSALGYQQGKIIGAFPLRDQQGEGLTRLGGGTNPVTEGTERYWSLRDISSNVIEPFDPEDEDALPLQLVDFISGTDTPSQKFLTNYEIDTVIPIDETVDINRQEYLNFYQCTRYYPFDSNGFRYGVYIGNAKYNYSDGNFTRVNVSDENMPDPQENNDDDADQLFEEAIQYKLNMSPAVRETREEDGVVKEEYLLDRVDRYDIETVKDANPHFLPTHEYITFESSRYNTTVGYANVFNIDDSNILSMHDVNKVYSVYVYPERQYFFDRIVTEDGSLYLADEAVATNLLNQPLATLGISGDEIPMKLVSVDVVDEDDPGGTTVNYVITDNQAIVSTIKGTHTLGGPTFTLDVAHNISKEAYEVVGDTQHCQTFISNFNNATLELDGVNPIYVTDLVNENLTFNKFHPVNFGIYQGAQINSELEVPAKFTGNFTYDVYYKDEGKEVFLGSGNAQGEYEVPDAEGILGLYENIDEARTQADIRKMNIQASAPEYILSIEDIKIPYDIIFNMIFSNKLFNLNEIYDKVEEDEILDIIKSLTGDLIINVYDANYKKYYLKDSLHRRQTQSIKEFKIEKDLLFTSRIGTEENWTRGDTYRTVEIDVTGVKNSWEEYEDDLLGEVQLVERPVIVFTPQD